MELDKVPHGDQAVDLHDLYDSLVAVGLTGRGQLTTRNTARSLTGTTPPSAGLQEFFACTFTTIKAGVHLFS
jgi:hypothetical protein